MFSWMSTPVHVSEPALLVKKLQWQKLACWALVNQSGKYPGVIRKKKKNRKNSVRNGYRPAEYKASKRVFILLFIIIIYY